jgi:putative pyruvate formate lyase activating enzyme
MAAGQYSSQGVISAVYSARFKCLKASLILKNWNIAHKADGFPLTPKQMAEWMVKIQDLGGCHNINFVTAEHVVPQVAMAIIEAKDMGLHVPIVYNTGGYDALEAIELLDGLVDIYLVDFKVCLSTSLN